MRTQTKKQPSSARSAAALATRLMWPGWTAPARRGAARGDRQAGMARGVRLEATGALCGGRTQVDEGLEGAQVERDDAEQVLGVGVIL